MIPIYDRLRHEKPPYVVFLLIVLNVLAFLYELTLNPDDRQVLFHLYGLVPARFGDPDWAARVGLPVSFAPILTGLFLHGGWMHLIGNMWFMWIFADNVEDRMGHFKFLVFYLVCGVTASLMHMALNINSGVPTIGASGAIAGVLGAYFLLFPGARIVAIVPVFVFLQTMEVPAFIFLGLWFLIQFLQAAGPAAAASGIAFWAHVGGFAAGLLLCRLFLKKRYGRARYVYR